MFERVFMSTLVTPRRIATVGLVLWAPGLLAQGPPIAGTPSPMPSRSCTVGHTALRAGVGGFLGAWVGFVGAKIKMSDWNSASHTPEGQRTRVVYTISGAAIGATIGALLHSSGSCGAAPGLPGARLGREWITPTDIAKSGQTGNVYDLVYSLRRNWLNLRGTNGLSEGPETVNIGGQDVTLNGAPELAVYLDNARLGNVDALRTVPVAGITGVRYYDPAEATMRWGAGNTHGAIQVTTTDIGPAIR
jgi:hypothetical protein